MIRNDGFLFLIPREFIPRYQVVRTSVPVERELIHADDIPYDSAPVG